MDIKRSVFIVDGQTEVEAFKGKFWKEYGCAPEFRRKNSNGEGVTPAGYVEGIYFTVFIALNMPFRHIICVLDREKRRMSSDRLCAEVKGLLIEKIVKQTPFKATYLEKTIKVFAPDVSFENWIVADIEGIKTRKELISEKAIQEDFEGKSGINVLKKIMKKPYKKILHGSMLFNRTAFYRSKNNSASLERFIIQLGL